MSTHRHPSADLAVEGRRRVRPRLAPPRHGLCARGAPTASSERHNGSPGDILLQGFHVRSCESQNPSWRTIVAENADVIRQAGFDLVWLPPSSASADPLGYLPTRWTSFDNSYGSRTELQAAIRALHPVKAVADVVVNHRCGVATGGVDFADPAFADPNKAVCQDDECKVGTGALDTGENQPAARDLDHTNPEVQTALKTVDGKPTGAIGWWPAMSVTFLDSHDTDGDPFGDGDQLLRGYAYTLTHPGIPSVYWPHFFDHGADLRGKVTALMNARKDSGVGRDSVVNIVAAETGLYAALIGDDAGMLAMKIGPGEWSPGDGYAPVIDGSDVAVWSRT